MYGKILIVEAIPTNRIVLKVKLAAAYYDVVPAASIAEAIDIVASTNPDLILSAIDLPDGSALDLARRLSGRGSRANMPILVHGAEVSTRMRLRLLSAGVDDVIDLEDSDALLLARVRSLIRATTSAAEWQLRDDATRMLGFAEQAERFEPVTRAVLVTEDKKVAATWEAALRSDGLAQIASASPQSAMAHASITENEAGEPNGPDIFIIHHQGDPPDAMLALVASIRAHATSRGSAILLVQEHANNAIAARALDLGADSVMQARFSQEEIALRVGALVRRKRAADQLRAALRTGLKAAVSDPLTGLHNRRYAIPQLTRVAERSSRTGRPFAVMVADLDHFKRVNDQFGHAAGDAVLIETARRLHAAVRNIDMVARIGGEEFLIVMPGLPLANARKSAKRICDAISGTPFRLQDGRNIAATISIGLAIGGPRTLRPGSSSMPLSDYAHVLINQADQALYKAKNRGRNCVKLGRPAA